VVAVAERDELAAELRIAAPLADADGASLLAVGDALAGRGRLRDAADGGQADLAGVAERGLRIVGAGAAPAVVERAAHRVAALLVGAARRRRRPAAEARDAGQPL